MSSAVLYQPGQMQVEHRPTPTAGPGEVVIAVEAVGVCGSDLHYYLDGRSGESVVSEPTILGHEASGVVHSLGEGVTRVHVGQRVAIEPGIRCGKCDQCIRGRYNLCRNMRFLGAAPIDGMMCEFVAVPEMQCHPVPDTVDEESASLVEPLSVAVWANEQARSRPGTRVLITGFGPIGVLTAQLAYARGARDIVVSDARPDRVEMATRKGYVRGLEATDVSKAGEFDIAIECSGTQGAVTAAAQALAPGGRLILVGVLGPVVQLPMSALQEKEATVLGTFRYRHCWPTAIQLLADGTVDVSDLITHRFSLSEAETAMKTAQSEPSAMKVIVKPQENLTRI